MSESKLPVSCSRCPAKGPRRKDAHKTGWLRVSHGGTSQAAWVCPTCRTAHETEQRAAARENPRPRGNAAFKAALLMSILGR